MLAYPTCCFDRERILFAEPPLLFNLTIDDLPWFQALTWYNQNKPTGAPAGPALLQPPSPEREFGRGHDYFSGYAKFAPIALMNPTLRNPIVKRYDMGAFWKILNVDKEEMDSSSDKVHCWLDERHSVVLTWTLGHACWTARSSTTPWCSTNTSEQNWAHTLTNTQYDRRVFDKSSCLQSPRPTHANSSSRWSNSCCSLALRFIVMDVGAVIPIRPLRAVCWNARRRLL